MNYIFPLLAVAVTIGFFLLYAMVRPNLRRSRPADELPSLAPFKSEIGD